MVASLKPEKQYKYFYLHLFQIFILLKLIKKYKLKTIKGFPTCLETSEHGCDGFHLLFSKLFKLRLLNFLPGHVLISKTILFRIGIRDLPHHMEEFGRAFGL